MFERSGNKIREQLQSHFIQDRLKESFQATKDAAKNPLLALFAKKDEIISGEAKEDNPRNNPVVRFFGESERMSNAAEKLAKKRAASQNP